MIKDLLVALRLLDTLTDNARIDRQGQIIQLHFIHLYLYDLISLSFDHVEGKLS